MGTQVVDVSSNNPHPIDWTRVRNSGRSAVIVKLTQSDGYVNPLAATDIRNAKAAGMIVAGYHFMSPVVSVADQMVFLEQHLDNLKFVWVDSETAAASWTAEGTATHAMESALAAKVKTGLYSNPNFVSNMPGAPWGSRLWLADYAPKPAYPYTLWQFTQTGSCPGIEGDVDLSYWPGSIPDLAALFG